MQRNKALWILVFSVIAVTIFTSTVSLHSRGQNKSIQLNQDEKKTSEQEKQKVAFYKQFPVADYDAPEVFDAEKKAERKSKNSRYDNRSMVTNELPEEDDERLAVIDSIPTPGIPVTESELIVTGEVIDAQAFVSNNKKGVYSEFTVRVDELLKNNSKNTEPKSLITIDREGGFVRYSNGQKRLYRISGFGMPRVGEKYLFFLDNPEKSQNYNVLTAYQLKAPEISNLDSFPQFIVYRGKSESDFMKSVRQATVQSIKDKTS